MDLQCLVIFNVSKYVTAVDILTFKSLHYKNKQMYVCIMENVAYFLQHSGLPQAQATDDNSG